MYFCPRQLPKVKGAPEGSYRALITLERLLDYITRYRLEVEVMWESIGAVYWIGGRSELPAGWRYTTVIRVVYLHTADKYHRLTRRPSQEQTGLAKRALMASQRPSHSW